MCIVAASILELPDRFHPLHTTLADCQQVYRLRGKAECRHATRALKVEGAAM
jgi:hypothetical protein